MATTTRSRKLKPNPHYKPCTVFEDDELFRNGIFVFNISRITEDILNKTLLVEDEILDVEDWLNKHCGSHINESHLPFVDISKPIIVAEIRPGRYEIIDGHHRFQKAHNEMKGHIRMLKLRGEQLLPYFIEKESYLCYINYWNDKLKEYGPDGNM